MVRLKVKCVKRSETERWGKPGGKLFGYEFAAVAGGIEENEKFFEATPNAEIKFAAVLFGAFEVGKEYYVDFSGPVGAPGQS